MYVMRVGGVCEGDVCVTTVELHFQSLHSKNRSMYFIPRYAPCKSRDMYFIPLDLQGAYPSVSRQGCMDIFSAWCIVESPPPNCLSSISSNGSTFTMETIISSVLIEAVHVHTICY